MNKYSERLFKEWRTHGKIIIAVDYDSTIFPWETIDNKEDRDRCVNLLRLAHETGAYLVINTCSNLDRYPEIQAYCEEMRLPISAINKNIIDLPYGKTGKIYANIYLDDRGGFKEAMDILEDALYKYRGHLQTLKPTTVAEV